MLYSDLETAVERAMERSAAKPTDRAYIEELLQLSYGIKKGAKDIVYRPFYVAARFLQQSRRDQTVSEADGAKFTGQAVPISSLLDIQRSLDLSLDVQPGFEVFDLDAATPSLKQLEAGKDAALIYLRRYQPRGVL